MKVLAFILEWESGKFHLYRELAITFITVCSTKLVTITVWGIVYRYRAYQSLHSIN